MRLTLVFAVTAAITIPASAERLRVHYSQGTGFFLSAYGDLVTNAHVVENCQPGSITLSGSIQSSARLVAMDQERDLALLRAERGIPDSARLAASERSINKGDTAMVIGYPIDRRHEHHYVVKYAKVLGINGPQGEEEWLQFSDSAQQGNSGGPLLDEAGNVIGVVTGKTQLYQVNQRTREQKLVSKSDIAVALPFLKRFLQQHRIRYQSAGSHIRRTPDYVEHRARRFIAQIRCVTRTERVR